MLAPLILAANSIISIMAINFFKAEKLLLPKLPVNNKKTKIHNFSLNGDTQVHEQYKI
jgi:hypothetical protein